eukprot:TRINITY_DN284_c0_g2_i4.p1 TRINITY_DN284_c0_g2~~TRINITY_DN284_c0_g2_i4.p1  ORF type:complete len:162 (-),score=24.20 TRINITY_DN284_c0_g2_i4:6-491(-)
MLRSLVGSEMCIRDSFFTAPCSFASKASLFFFAASSSLLFCSSLSRAAASLCLRTSLRRTNSAFVIPRLFASFSSSLSGSSTFGFFGTLGFSAFFTSFFSSSSESLGGRSLFLLVETFSSSSSESLGGRSLGRCFFCLLLPFCPCTPVSYTHLTLPTIYSV